jgi:hypothetical protein
MDDAPGRESFADGAGLSETGHREEGSAPAPGWNNSALRLFPTGERKGLDR